MSLFQTLKPKPKHNAGSSTCLLLDVSGSMDCTVDTEGHDGHEPRRVEVLFKAVRETPECQGLKAYFFSDSCNPVEVIPDEQAALNFRTMGGTNLAGAFHCVKSAGFYSAILVTDGQPDSASAALTAAMGMKLGIIYIGNPPVPQFLKDLAEATDGTFALADMRDVKQLENAIVAALPAPDADPKSNTGGGAINL